MGWIKQIVENHRCNLPNLYGSGRGLPGSIWQCDYCTQVWTVIKNPYSDYAGLWDTYEDSNL
jgi:hypothetical protein